jgi:hypothetical protein
VLFIGMFQPELPMLQLCYDRANMPLDLQETVIGPKLQSSPATAGYLSLHKTMLCKDVVAWVEPSDCLMKAASF